MKKLELNADALQIESFDIASEGKAQRGTVQGRNVTFYGEATCVPHCADTNYTSIGSTCGNCTADPAHCPRTRPGEYGCQTM